MRNLFVILWLALALGGNASASGAKPGLVKDFKSGSQAHILAAHAGKSLAIAFWSLDCAHCPSSLRVLADFGRRHPGLAMVLVATDDEGDPEALARHVRELGLGQVAQWRFADPLPERLRMEIDPRWWGELPRTLLVDAHGERRAVSGVLTHAALADWFAQAR